MAHDLRRLDASKQTTGSEIAMDSDGPFSVGDTKN